MTVLLGTLWSSIKQIEAPYVFDWETQLLWTQCRGIGPHLSGRGKSHGFSRVAAGVYSRVTAGMSIRNSGLFIEVRNLSMYEGQLRNVN